MSLYSLSARKSRILVTGILITLASLSAYSDTDKVSTDAIQFGNAASEKAHGLTADHSKTITGLLGETARILLPLDAPSWQGGSLRFSVKVDPDHQNYITIRLSGDDVTENHLNLICDGKQVGYRHLGDIEMLELGTDQPFKNGRFYYRTSPLPLQLTKGADRVILEIRSTGHIWGYGNTFDKYQHDMTVPTRGLYELYIHTNPTFTPPTDEKQGKAPAYSVAKANRESLIRQIKERVNGTIDNLLNQQRPLSQVQMQLLAKAYRVKWTDAYQNRKVVDKITEGLDTLFVVYSRYPRLAEADSSTWNADWFGLGITGQVMWLLKGPLQQKLDVQITYPGASKQSRREAYSRMLIACRDWHRQHRRMYSNQSMINDLYGIYYANKGLQNINPARASDEEKMLTYLYESLGLQPWTGSIDSTGNPNYIAGKNYWELTRKGLTKELGYVGNYGEVLDWVSEIYDATKPEPGLPGNQRIKEQIQKIALARCYFRYPANDPAGNIAMRQQVVVGWRDVHYPGDVTYLQRASWDGTPFQVAVATQDPVLLSYAQQMLREEQFVSSFSDHMKDKGFRVTAGLLNVPDEYQFVQSYQSNGPKLPMSEGEPDFVFADEEDGVVAVKNGTDYFYASLYWRARNAINFLGRVHLVQPAYDRIATIAEEEEFDNSGLIFYRPGYTNFGFAKGGPRYPDTTQSAHTGEALPIAKIPAGVDFRPGDESPYAGKATLYKMAYDRYYVIMNNSPKDYTASIPAQFKNAVDLNNGKKPVPADTLIVKAGTTAVLYK